MVRKVIRRRTVTYEGRKVRQVIVRRSDEINACYAAVSKHTPDLYGRVVLEWEIGPKGKVRNVWVIEPLKSELDQCIVSRLRTWIFPEPPGRAVAKVSFPFSFNEVERKAASRPAGAGKKILKEKSKEKK